MLERELRQYEFLLDFLGQLLSDIPPERMTEQPVPGMNTPAWIVGHLGLVNDQALGLLGQPLAGPARWVTLFDAGTPPVPGEAPFPSKEELHAELTASAGRLSAAVAAADEATLRGPNQAPYEFARSAFPTTADMLGFLTGGHFATHLGQLSAWRRAAGYTPLF